MPTTAPKVSGRGRRVAKIAAPVELVDAAVPPPLVAGAGTDVMLAECEREGVGLEIVAFREGETEIVPETEDHTLAVEEADAEVEVESELDDDVLGATEVELDFSFSGLRRTLEA